MALFPDDQMAIPRSLIIFWSFLAMLMLVVAFLQWRHEQRQFLPVPGAPQLVRIDNGTDTLLWQWQNGHWHINDQPADDLRIAAWFEQLRACRGNYDGREIAPTPDPHPVQLVIDDAHYALGAANPFGNNHYITHNGRVYLCDESVKATLRLPVNLWLENPDARTP